MGPDPRDRRKEERRAADVELMLVIEDPVAAVVHARVVDVSRSGFRARHSYPRFEPGQQVRFHYPDSTGQARVIWNRILTDHVETGFLVLS